MSDPYGSYIYIPTYGNYPILYGMAIILAVAALIALAAERPKRPLTQWVLDYFVKWGLASILIWFVIHGYWALRELLNMRLVVPFSPLEAYLEYVTFWSAVASGFATFIFLGASLLINAIFSKPPRLMYSKAIYYDGESLVYTLQMYHRPVQTAQPAPRQPQAALTSDYSEVEKLKYRAIYR